MLIRYFAYNFGEPIYYALVEDKNGSKEYVWSGDRWVENITNFLEYLRIDGSPYLDSLSEEEILGFATPFSSNN